MNILVYRGSFQYGVVDLFIDNIVFALKKKKHTVTEINLNEANVSQTILTSFSKEVFDCVIGVGGIGSNIKLDNGQYIYDATNTNYMAIYIDHPVHLMSRLIEPIKNHLISFIDMAHVKYINDVLPQSHKLNFFLPHGAMQIAKTNQISLKEYQSLKDIDVLFSGTFMGKPEKPWKGIPHFPEGIFDKTCEKLIFNDYMSIHETFEQVCDDEGICFSTISKAQLASLMVNIITYIRQYKRYELLKKLIESGLHITICGKGWDNFVKSYDNVSYKGPLDVKDALALTQRAKVVINATPNFSHGSHERVYTGMLNHAVLFSDKSSYLDEDFKHNEHMLFYSFETLEEDIENLKVQLENNSLFEMSQKAYEITVQKHTWEQRVDKILEMIMLSKAMDN